MAPVRYFLSQVWQWVAETGVDLAIILLLAFLVPRAGRLAERLIERNIKESVDEEKGKTHLAFAGVMIYVAQIIAYFLLSVWFLQELGFSLAGAAIPATVASAAIGFGAQSIIADFLAGFFVLTEKQYGVGDWVRFVGNGVEVEGTVIQVTMRATQIRTLKQETVIVPNSTARVSINTSNFWSRAVIVMPVPLLGSTSATEAAERAESATRRALEKEEIADDLIGELEVQPAVDITPPATVGMPWTVDMRFMVQVEAGTQWQVERTVRMSILEEFWDEYGSATTVTGALTDVVRPSTEPVALGALAADDDAEAATERWRPAPDQDTQEAPETSADDPEKPEQAPAEHSTVPAGYESPSGKDPAADQGGAGVTAGDPEAKTVQASAVTGADEETDDGTAKTVAMGSTAATATAATKIVDPALGDEEQSHDPDQADGEDEEDEAPQFTGWRHVITAGSNMRISTAFMLIGLLVLLMLRLLMSSAETADGEQVRGPLAPRPIGVTSQQEETVPEDGPTQEDVRQTPQQPATPTDQRPAPTTTPQAPLGTTAPTTPGSQQTQTTAPTTPQQQQQQQTPLQDSPTQQEQTATQQQTEPQPMSPASGAGQNYLGGNEGTTGTGAESGN